MDKLTKEQIGLFTAIASILMLVAFFFIKFGGQAPVEYFSRGAGWFSIITLVIAMLAPIYTTLYAYRDQKALEPLKPIFVLGSFTYALPIVALGLVLLGMFFDGGWPVILYCLGAACVYKIGESDK